MIGRRRISSEALEMYAADSELAAKFSDLLRGAEQAEDALRQAQARGAPLAELRRLGPAFDAALTSAMRAAYAAERAEIGPRGYDDWIFRRKAKARPSARMWRAEADRLLTMREEHRLTGVPRVPPSLAS